MSVTSERELTKRVQDLENALRIVREVAADPGLKPSQRLHRIVGITRMQVPTDGRIE